MIRTPLFLSGGGIAKIMNLSWIIMAIAAAANLGLVSFMAAKQKGALKKPSNLTFILSVFFLLLWSLFNSLADNSVDPSAALFWTRASFPASLLALLMVLWFSYAFPMKTKEYRGRLVVYSLWAAAFSVLAMSRYVISGVELEKNIGISGINTGGAYPAIMALYFVLLGGIICNLRAKYKKTEGARRAQIKYVILGWGLFLGGALATNLILPYFTGNANWSKFGPLFSIFMVASISYAVIRHRLMDIRVVIQRGFIFTVLLVLVAGFYLAAVFTLGYLFQKITDITVFVSAGATVIAGVFGVPPLKRYFRRATDRLFFKDKYDYSLAMSELSEILNKNISLEDITREASEKLKEIMKASKVVFYGAEKERAGAPKAAGGELEIGITLENERIGSVLLGKKLSGDAYTEEDEKLLRTFAYQAAVALKKAEMYGQMKNYSRELEERVKRRTATIEELQEEQKQIIMDISHGLQTPLTIIKSELGVLQKQKINTENFAVLEKSIDRISKFIYDLLRLARLEAAEGGFKKEPVDVSGMLEDLVEEFGIVAEEKNISIRSAVAPGVSALGDKRKLEELITNLVSNAMKYIANERKIFISLSESGGKAKLAVEDTGVGIGEKDLPNIFNRFYRVKENRPADAKGTGLGLAICRKIAERHGGEIKAESAVGKGTKFTVTLPARLTP